ncbi:MAG: hypothetical protein MUE85_03360 [Microscillaceae bacterium]|jgi:hypothetical protein|nr:hypothetical protein [Microscillaceae bacterium]
MKEISISQKRTTLFIWGGLIGLSLAFYNLTTLGLFFQQLSRAEFLQAMIGAGIAGMILYRIFAFFQLYSSIYNVGLIFLGFISLFLAGYWLAYETAASGSAWRQMALMGGLLGLIPINNLLNLIFWGTTERILTTEEFKTNRDWINGGWLAMQVLAWVLIALLLNQWTLTNGMGLILSAAFGFSVFVGFIYLGGQFPYLKHIITNPQYVHAHNSWDKLYKKSYFLYLAGLTSLASILILSIDYLFFVFTQHNYFNSQTKVFEINKFVRFLGLWSAFALIAGFALRFWAYRPIVRNYGLRVGMLVLPMALGFFCLVILGLSLSYSSDEKILTATILFMLLVICKLIREIVYEGLQVPIYRVYLLPIDSELRLDIQLRLDGFWANLGLILGASMLYLMLEVEANLWLPIIFGITVALTLVLVVWYLHEAYKKELQSVLSKNQGKTLISEKGKYVTLEEKILDNIRRVPVKNINLHLNILRILNPLVYKTAILRLLDTPEQKIQSLLRNSNQNIQAVVDFTNKKVRDLSVSKDTNEIALALYRKTRQLANERSKQSMIKDEKLENLIFYVDEKVRQIAIDGKMYNLNTGSTYGREDSETEFFVKQIAEELDLKIYQTATQLFKDIQHLTLDINEPLLRTALFEAQKWCILEAIPLLYILINSKYYAVLHNAELVQKTYELLRGAEYRLERIKYIQQLTFSKLENERIFGALLTAYASDEYKPQLLNQLFQDESYWVKYYSLIATAHSEAPELQNILIDRLANPLFSNLAFAILTASGEKVLNALESAFYMTGQKEIIQIRIVQIYGLIGSEQAIEFLLRKINYSNQNVRAMVIEMLSKCGLGIPQKYRRNISQEIENTCEALVWNMSVYLDLERVNSEETLLKAMKSEIDNNYTQIFDLMMLIYDSQSVEIVRENVNSGNADKADFAGELLDIFLEDTTKPLLIPLLNTADYATKVAQTQYIFPTEPLKPEEALISLVQRDYRWVNIWTKACALYELLQGKNLPDNQIFAANLPNPEVVLREIASKALQKLNGNEYKAQYQPIYRQKRYAFVEETINQISEEVLNEDVPNLKFEIAKFFQEIPGFSRIPGLILARIAAHTEIISAEAGQIIVENLEIWKMDYYAVYSGEVVLQQNQVALAKFLPKTLIHSLPYIPENQANITLQAQTSAILYRIPQAELHELMSFYEEIPISLLAIDKA